MTSRHISQVLEPGDLKPGSPVGKKRRSAFTKVLSTLLWIAVWAIILCGFLVFLGMLVGIASDPFLAGFHFFGLR